VIIDDRWGRDLAQHYDLDCQGTLWVLEQLHDLRLVPSAQVRASVKAMRDRGIRLPRKAVDALLARIGEEPLSL
jgi:predicted nucleic acid-binding protein